MHNIKFSYLYRDGGNYKKYDYVIFANTDNIDLSEIETLIHPKFIGGEWFYADQWGLTELFLETFDFKIDPTWHEFEVIEYTNDAPNAQITLSEFIHAVAKTKLI
jgi:hypothetical protein